MMMNSPATAKRASRRRRQKWFLLARRAHLYFGLFLVPWVFLYGVTALLFNHPAWFHERSMTQFGAGALAETDLASPPAADTIAAAVHEALPGDLSAPENIRWVGRYRLRGSDDSSRYSAYIESGGQGGILYTTPLDADSAHPLANLEPSPVPFPLSKETELASIEQALQVSGLALDRTPTLLFDVREGDALWRIEYEPLDGSLSAALLGQRSTTQTTRSFLLNLHTQHVYPGAVSARWLWAAVVDLMGGAMVLWALTGLIMWWQLKRLRRIGGAVLVVGVSSIAALAISLFAAFGF
jgi:hypothetical protein